MTIDKLTGTALEMALKICRKQIIGQSGEHRIFLDKYKSILLQLESSLKLKGAGQRDWRAIGSALIDQFEKIKNSVQAYAFDSEKIAQMARSTWHEQVEIILSEFPEVIEDELDEEPWRSQDCDSTIIRLRKKLLFVQCRTTRFISLMRRADRNVLGGVSQPAQLPRRSFNLHNFFRFQLGLPVSNILTQQIQALNSLITENIQALHLITDNVGDALLPLNILNPGSADEQSENSANTVARIEEHVRHVMEMIDQVNTWEKLLTDLFEAEISSIKSEFKYSWQLAGTIVLPESQYNQQSILRKHQKIEKQQAKLLAICKNQFKGHIGEWQKDLELSLLQFRCANLCLKTLGLVRDEALVKIMASTTDAKTMIRDMNVKLSADQAKIDFETFRSLLGDSRNQLDTLRQDKLPQIMDTVQSVDLEKIYGDFLSEAMIASDLLSDHYLLFQAYENDVPSPISSIEPVRLKKIVMDDVFPRISDSHSLHSLELQSIMQQAMRIVSEIDQIVEFNIEASIKYLVENEGRQALEKSHRMAVEGLQRAEDRLCIVGDKFQEISSLADSSLKAMTLGLLQKLQDLADTRKVIEIKIRLARSIAREKFRQTQRNIIHKIISFAFLRTAFDKIYAQIGSVFRRARVYTEIRKSDSSVDQQLSSLLRESHQKVSHLPYVYQRLFSLSPLSDSRFFSGRTHELDTISSEFNAWKSKGCISVAIVGERGSGKTTLVNFADSRVFADFPIVRIELTNTVKSEATLVEMLKAAFGESDIHSVDELENKLVQGNDRKICILENLHELFIRTVDGFEALERFLLFVYKTQDHIFWVVTSGLYGWQYLDKVLKISNHFQRVIMLGTLSKEDVTEIITKRHRVSGYDLEIVVDEDFRQTKTYRKLANDSDRQQYLLEQLFERLALFSSGNIRVAMQFWLATIKDFSGEKLTLASGLELKLDFVKQLPAKDLFTFAALIQHENLSAEEHALVFRRDVGNSEILLEKLLNIGLLQKSEMGYLVHPFIYRTAVNALKEKNIFH